MGASASQELKPQVIQEATAAPKAVAVERVMTELAKLEKLVPAAAPRSDVTWHDLVFLAQLGDDPDRAKAKKGLQDLWHALKEWSRASGVQVEAGQEQIWELFNDVKRLAGQLEDSSRDLAKTCRGVSEGGKIAASLKSSALEILREVDKLSSRVERLHKRMDQHQAS